MDRCDSPLSRKSGSDLRRRPAARSWRCELDTIVTAPENDWMEWQAAYIGGALLMPCGNVIVLASQGCRELRKSCTRGALDAPVGRDLTRPIRKHFQVSEQAALLRLSRMGCYLRSETAGFVSKYGIEQFRKAVMPSEVIWMNPRPISMA